MEASNKIAFKKRPEFVANLTSYKIIQVNVKLTEANLTSYKTIQVNVKLTDTQSHTQEQIFLSPRCRFYSKKQIM